MSALPKLTISNFELRVSDPREGRIVRTLSEVYPNSISAKQLMIRAGLAFHSEPVTSFVTLCNLRIRINRSLSRHGWQAVSTGGTPDDHYRLVPVS